MRKSVIFLLNGLGIERQGSYSISIDQCMPNLSRTKETSFFTTAIIDSVEYKTAYERFFLGETYKKEVKYINSSIVNDQVINNPTFSSLKNSLSDEKSKLHVFIEPTNDLVVDSLNELIKKLDLNPNQKVFLHLLLTQQTVTEYKKLIEIVNYIKYHIDTRITVGFIIGKELISENPTTEDLDMVRKIFFYGSCERWTETEKKFTDLMESKIRPCEAPGFSAINGCNIENKDVIFFYNTRKSNYDKYITSIYTIAPRVFRNDSVRLDLYSLIRLDTKYRVNCFAENIVYENSLANILNKSGIKTLVITKNENINYINFLVNGLNHVKNPNIDYMVLDENYFSNIGNVSSIIDNSKYHLIIFDYHMDVSKTINELKEGLEKIDVVLGNVVNTCTNKHSLFITSLYGLKKELPLADYNSEMVTLDYEMQIPIFFYDYTYPRSKYTLVPGETNDILNTAIRCLWNNPEIYSLIRTKGFFGSLFRK